ncbi:cysteine-rich repeat secretory protein 1-like [Neltuma alba]|uniref:cysteine-rich repeat secretory protein 1-like n=1 Tax=Neltuma alba TaxID=207710 RepID=UPI0010A2B27A|nr:cysteine-rich repeat secretory protein 1-like [Prosopis alba]
MASSSASAMPSSRLVTNVFPAESKISFRNAPTIKEPSVGTTSAGYVSPATDSVKTPAEALGRKMDMPFLKLLSYFLLLSSFDLASSEVDIPAYFDHNCTINKNFTSDSSYPSNLNSLFGILYDKATGGETPEFFNTSYEDVVYGEFMCRGDVPIQVCRDCVQDAINRIASECPYNKEAVIWYDQCSLRYSDRSFFSTLDQLPRVSSQLVAMDVTWETDTCLPGTPDPEVRCQEICSKRCKL